MKDKFKTRLNIFVNITLFLTIVGITYSWMVTSPSAGELVSYDRDLVITSSDVTVDIYAYIDGTYVEQTTSPMNLGLLAPGVEHRYRFDITNSNDAPANTKIVFTNITGDTTDLATDLVFGSTSPTTFSFALGDRLQQNTEDYTYYFNFSDKVTIPANDTISIYWYATVLETATVEIGDTGIAIDTIAFINP